MSLCRPQFAPSGQSLMVAHEMQVELASLDYKASRLVRSLDAASGQRGGFGEGGLSEVVSARCALGPRLAHLEREGVLQYSMNVAATASDPASLQSLGPLTQGGQSLTCD